MKNEIMKKRLAQKHWANFKFQPKVDPSKVDIIVASYNENLWYVDDLQSYGYRVKIYNTSGLPFRAYDVDPVTNQPLNVRPVVAEHIPNQSREASQWLHHLLYKRAELNDYNVFVQADLGARMGCPLIQGTRVERYYDFLHFLCSFSATAHWLHVPCPTSVSERVHLDLRKKYAQLFSPEPTPDFTARYPGVGCAGGEFLISKQSVLRIPESHIQKLYDYAAKNPKAAWEWEWIWPFLLDAFGAVWPIQDSLPASKKTASKELALISQA
jgi:dimeric dUTPase (all-alpha-NTP-PPase superfamily)